MSSRYTHGLIKISRLKEIIDLGKISPLDCYDGMSFISLYNNPLPFGDVCVVGIMSINISGFSRSELFGVSNHKREMLTGSIYTYTNIVCRNCGLTDTISSQGDERFSSSASCYECANCGPNAFGFVDCRKDLIKSSCLNLEITKLIPRWRWIT